jgi:3-oxoacyl-[acyl-carrier protein] reductase
VLVTGGNRGIGLAVARAFQAAGDRVAVTSRHGEVDGLFSVACDVTSSDVDQLLLSMKEEAFTTVIDTNLVGAYRVTRRATSKMIRARRGRIILISSVVALTGSAGQSNYAASKAGMIGFARSLARELGSRNVTVNVVSPGFVTTDMTAALPESRQVEILAQVPLKRMATPDEIAATVQFLASDGAAYITGAVIPVDGGLGMGH